MEPENNRRSFLGLVVCGLGAIFSAIFGSPIVCYVADPRHRKGPRSAMKLVEGIKLDELARRDPRQGVIRDVRLDGWTLYPNDVIGRVWVVRVGDRPDLSTPEKVKTFNESSAAVRDAYLLVFTTICPHLGCSVNSVGAAGFACPCHNATFALSGQRVTDANPAKRGMDTLEWEIDDADPGFNRIKVKYQNFATSIEEKRPAG